VKRGWGTAGIAICGIPEMGRFSSVVNIIIIFNNI